MLRNRLEHKYPVVLIVLSTDVKKLTFIQKSIFYSINLSHHIRYPLHDMIIIVSSFHCTVFVIYTTIISHEKFNIELITSFNGEDEHSRPQFTARVASGQRHHCHCHCH